MKRKTFVMYGIHENCSKTHLLTTLVFFWGVIWLDGSAKDTKVPSLVKIIIFCLLGITLVQFTFESWELPLLESITPKESSSCSPNECDSGITFFKPA